MSNDEAVKETIEALEAAGVDYMLVGSFSSNVYGVSRSTKDADFVIECRPDAVPSIVTRLGPGFRLERQIQFESVTGTVRYIVQVVDSPFRIELFRLSDDDHDRQRFARRRKMPYAALGCDVFIPTPEDVIITKLRWAANAGRGKDRDDVRDVIAVQGDASIDWSYVNRWTEQHGTRGLLDEIRQSIPPMDEE